MSINLVAKNLSDLCEPQFTPLPLRVMDRAGLIINITSKRWELNSASYQCLDWDRLDGLPESILNSLQLYVVHRIERVSPMEVTNFFGDAVCLLKALDSWKALNNINLDCLATALYKHLVKIIEMLRKTGRIYTFYRIREWYNWSIDMLPLNTAFDEEYAVELNRIYVPSNVKGELVRTEDLDNGPLMDAEIEVLRRALQQDKSVNHRHIMQRAAIAISLAFGRNSMNVMLLRELDLITLRAADNKQQGEYLLRMPRIKKRYQTYRQDFRDCYLDLHTKKYLQDLIEANRVIKTGVFPRPIFMRLSVDERRLGTASSEFSFHVDPKIFRVLMLEFTKRLSIVSHRTNALLNLTPRRLRYTLATRMVAQGASAQALAKLLDHSDTQNVQVYFELGAGIVEQLDKAAAVRIGSIVGAFQGKLIASKTKAINGSNPARNLNYPVNNLPKSDMVNIGVCGQEDLCRLDPPYSCYLCAKFQPYKAAHHGVVLEDLLSRRERILQTNDSRLAVQLDSIIYAVGKVVSLITNAKQTKLVNRV